MRRHRLHRHRRRWPRQPEAHFVSTLGRLGIGTNTPDSRLDVEQSTTVDLRLTATGGSAWRLINDSAGFAVEQVGAAFRAVKDQRIADLEGRVAALEGMLRELAAKERRQRGKT